MDRHYESIKDFGDHLFKTHDEFVDWHERRGKHLYIALWRARQGLSIDRVTHSNSPRCILRSVMLLNRQWATQALDSWKYFIPDLESKGVPRDLIYLIVEFCGDIFDLPKEMLVERMGLGKLSHTDKINAFDDYCDQQTTRVTSFQIDNQVSFPF